MRYLWLFLVSFLFIGCSDSDNESPHPVVPQTVTTVTIATYNLHDLNYENAYEGVAKVLHDYHVDVALFQEIQKEDEAPLKEALKALQIDYPYVVFSTQGGYGGADGEDYYACFSKYPIKESETILGESGKDPITGEQFDFIRPILKTEIEVKQQKITLYDLHLKAHSPFPNCPLCVPKRRAQSKELAQYVQANHELNSDYVVIAGDINCAVADDYSKGGTLDILLFHGLFTPVNHTLLPDTATHNKYDQKFDHMILSPALYQKYQADSIKIPTIEPNPTDHKPVILSVDL